MHILHLQECVCECSTCKTPPGCCSLKGYKGRTVVCSWCPSVSGSAIQPPDNSDESRQTPQSFCSPGKRKHSPTPAKQNKNCLKVAHKPHGRASTQCTTVYTNVTWGGIHYEQIRVQYNTICVFIYCYLQSRSERFIMHLVGTRGVYGYSDPRSTGCDKTVWEVRGFCFHEHAVRNEACRTNKD